MQVWHEAPNWKPLEQLSRLLVERSLADPIDPDDFMFMGAVDTVSGVRVYLYKHADTRRYLNIDDSGHQYEYGEGAQYRVVSFAARSSG